MTEKFLIIDDDLDTLHLVGLMLHNQGYQIAAAVLYQPESMTNHQINKLTITIAENEIKKE